MSSYDFTSGTHLITERLSIGVPCYEKLTIDLFKFTLLCAKRSMAVEAIHAERELRASIEEEFSKIPYYIRGGSGKHLTLDTLNGRTSVVYGVENRFEGFLYADDSIIREVESIDLSGYLQNYFEEMDPDRVALYIASLCLERAKVLYDLGEILDAKRYLLQVGNYVKSHEYTTLFNNYLTVSFTSNDVVNQYQSFMEAHPDLICVQRIVDDSYLTRAMFVGKDDVRNHILINNLLTMPVVETKEEFIKEGHASIEGGGSTKSKASKGKQLLDKQAIEEALKEKMYFYLEMSPVAEFVCYHSFSKYRAFLYENGRIFADRFYKVNQLNELKSDAAYQFDASNFETSIQYNKQELIEMGYRRYHHVGAWKERIRVVATEETNAFLRNESKKLVKRLEKRSE